MQKPVIIYSMPRTKSTAALQACKRSSQIFEPFNSASLFQANFHNLGYDNKTVLRCYLEYNNKIYKTYADHANNLEMQVVNDLFRRLNNTDTVSKIVSTELVNYLPARKWMSNADMTGTHDIFVLIRDLREQMFSFLLASNFGFFKTSESVPEPITINEDDILRLRLMIDNFLRFVPQNATLIEFDKLPNSHFDYSKINMVRQNSLDNMSYICNLDYCEYHISHIIRYYADEWQTRLSVLRTAA